MNPDKVLISVAAIILLSLFMLRGRIIEEAQLFTQTEAEESTQDVITAFFYPLTEKERIEIIQGHLNIMNELQDKASRSLIARFFIDYSESIQEQKKDLEEREERLNEGWDFISFSTLKLHHIIAAQEFTKEQLLELASLIDEMFGEEGQTALFSIERDSKGTVIEMTPYEGFESWDRHGFQTFVNRASRNIFDNEAITLLLGHYTSESGEVFESN